MLLVVVRLSPCKFKFKLKCLLIVQFIFLSMVKKHVLLNKSFHVKVSMKKAQLQKKFPNFNWTFSFVFEKAFACWEKGGFKLD